jgi:hypothetical protein
MSRVHTVGGGVELGERERGRGDQSAGDQQRGPGTEPADQPAGQRREDQRSDRDRQVDQPGMHGGEATLALQVQRHHQHKRTPRGERTHRATGGRGERDAGKEPHVDERVAAPRLVAQKRGERHRRDDADLGSGQVPESDPAHAGDLGDAVNRVLRAGCSRHRPTRSRPVLAGCIRWRIRLGALSPTSHHTARQR